MRSLVAITAAFWLVCGANGARVCGNSTTTFNWRLGDIRFDGGSPSDNKSHSTVAASISPAPRGTLFECVAQWPETWNGWYDGSNSIIWSDCIWTGNGGTADRTISFALDWKSRVFYLSHTFNCSDRNGSAALATGSVDVNLNCTTTSDGGSVCDLSPRTGINLTTTELPVGLGPGASCAENAKRYQSWEVSKWSRQYVLEPGSTGLPRNDTGPSFTLSNMANSDVLDCKTSGIQSSTFEGSCTSLTANSTTSGSFRFNRDTDMLTVAQQWKCGNS
ncbi:hypothetical protein GQ53DRAFT_815617 [Thozetella sp. PMI_491]|nr:hypothetical protein GQ53DRAFT_815617 [Thozetella sp. PMI_491]